MDRYCIHVGGFCIIPVCLVIVAAHEFILFVKAFDRYSTSPSINSDAGHSERSNLETKSSYGFFGTTPLTSCTDYVYIARRTRALLLVNATFDSKLQCS